MLNEEDIKYIIAVFYVANNETLSENNNRRPELDSVCPILRDFKYRFSRLRKKGSINKGNYCSLDRANTYFFDKFDVLEIRIYIDRFTKDEISDILKKYGVMT